MDKILSLAESTADRLPRHVELVLSILRKSVGDDPRVLVEKSFIFLCAVNFFECGFALDDDMTGARAHNLVPTFDLRSVHASCVKAAGSLKCEAPDLPLTLRAAVDRDFRLVVVPAAGACILNFLLLPSPEEKRPTIVFSVAIHPLAFLAPSFDCHDPCSSSRQRPSRESFRNLRELSLCIKDSIVNPATNIALAAEPVVNTRSITGLPYEVLLHLASLLDVSSILRLTSTCKELLGFGRDTFLWKMLLRRDLGVDMDCSMAYEDLVEEYKMRTRPPKITCCCSSPYFRSIEDFQPRRYFTNRSSDSESFNSIGPYVIALRQASPNLSVSNDYSNNMSRQ
ncbi:unnamed protein product [Bemisia tabaci]|uniref:F-box domain-containing protein n=1 Tax=Bemisia tabaci TaxID=7038 RepID=A0A9P0C8F2_BEMTA|nr:unnamed protein product [Bemisia tabaci]